MNLTQSARLYRPIAGRTFAGVCAGIARFFNIDVSLVRIGWVLFTLLGGSGVPAYLIVWLVMPDETGQRDVTPLIVLALLIGLPFLGFLLSILSPFLRN